MARSKNGCLKILACAGAGSDPSAGSDADADDHVDESKAISDKSRWSFRRRSTRHRVLKNSDISEPETLSSSKAKSEIAPSNNVYSSAYSYASEKPLHQEKPDEKQMEKPMEKPVEKPIERPVEKPIEKPAEKIDEKAIEKPDETVFEKPTEEPTEKTVENPIENLDESISVSTMELKQEETTSLVEGSSAAPEEDHIESAAVVIQSGIKAYMARRELSHHKDLVKLQAVIRGHLVRRQAAETLRCLLAIIKMQALVRAHQASTGECQDTLVRSSSAKLLQNGFALKIMDSLSTSKAIHIKCDPSETDLTWKWLERWTALIPPNTGTYLLECRENSELVVDKVNEDAQHEDKIVPLDSDLTFPKLVPDDVKETEAASDSSALEAPVCVPDTCTGVAIKDDPLPELVEKMNEETEQLTDTNMENAVEESLESDPQAIQTDPSRELSPLPEKRESSNEGIKNEDEQQLEMEGKRLVARKSCNPAFAAAQLKFQELSSNSSVSRPISSSYLDGASKLKVHSPHSQEDASSKRNHEAGLPESSVINDPKIVVAASECGTEISISSTLDSPDRSETDGGEIVLEIGSLENRNYVNNKADKDTSVVHSEVKNTSEVEDIEVQPHKEEPQNGNAVNPVVAADPVLVEQPHVEPEKSDLHDQLEKPHAMSPEGTPRSRVTVSESYGTPSSEVSVNTKKSKSKSKKPKSHVSKRSLSSPSSDSVGRTSTDNMSKESKHANRESSVKVTKPDHVDQEPRMSNSNPLPSYMQFTESARAKASASISPKLSPDVQDNNPRKRHSLPMANGKQDSSPRMQRSSSQAQQNVKSNGTTTQNSSERRWHI